MSNERRYQDMARSAKEGGFDEIADWFEGLRRRERESEKLKENRHPPEMVMALLQLYETALEEHDDGEPECPLCQAVLEVQWHLLRED